MNSNRQIKNEQREIQKIGDKKFNKIRPKQKFIKELICSFLDSKPEECTTDTFNGQTTRLTTLVKALYEKALSGDLKAFEILMKYSGYDPDTEMKEAEIYAKVESMKEQSRTMRLKNDEKEQDPFNLSFFYS